jgi:catalase (peroxidase I)
MVDEAALAGVTAIETMGGPRIPWQPGRTDYTGGAAAEEHRGQVGDRCVRPVQLCSFACTE